MTDTDPHQRVSKNGKDKAQDRDLRELRETVQRQLDNDQIAHASILEKLTALDKDLLVTHARDEEKSKAEASLRKLVLTLAVLFMSILSGIVAWAAMEFRELHEDVANNTAHFREFQAIGIEWGDNIDDRAEGFRDDLRQLRRLVNEHQRNKREHSHRD
jgi:hypothetical protein